MMSERLVTSEVFFLSGMVSVERRGIRNIQRFIYFYRVWIYNSGKNIRGSDYYDNMKRKRSMNYSKRVEAIVYMLMYMRYVQVYRQCPYRNIVVSKWKTRFLTCLLYGIDVETYMI